MISQAKEIQFTVTLHLPKFHGSLVQLAGFFLSIIFLASGITYESRSTIVSFRILNKDAPSKVREITTHNQNSWMGVCSHSYSTPTHGSIVSSDPWEESHMHNLAAQASLTVQKHAVSRFSNPADILRELKQHYMIPPAVGTVDRSPASEALSIIANKASIGKSKPIIEVPPSSPTADPNRKVALPISARTFRDKPNDDKSPSRLLCCLAKPKRWRSCLSCSSCTCKP